MRSRLSRLSCTQAVQKLFVVHDEGRHAAQGRPAEQALPNLRASLPLAAQVVSLLGRGSSLQ
ncbi:hypothetical protein BEI_0741 [Halomonas beimenensis]|uniref:Uncharacterized protein n=1 Tax=Halomonas beimenensis TaxID=475662 RepID=A0A291P4D4_9GAMM|nr:hypothetical protein BEI_0741 [Halomonas beimenensis]